MQGKQQTITNLLNNLQTVTNWQDAFEIGKTLYEKTDGDKDPEVLSAFQTAFDRGLNVLSAKEEFLKAKQIVARLHFKYQDYDEAKNDMFLLLENDNDQPDWVHLNFAAAQVFTDDLEIIAALPFKFFEHLDHIDFKNSDDVTRRNSIFKNYLSYITCAAAEDKITGVDHIEIIKKAIKYDLNESEELKAFCDLFAPGYDIPPLPKLSGTEATQKIHDLQTKLKEQEEIIALYKKEYDELLETIHEKDTHLLDLKKQNEEIIQQNENELAKYREKLEEAQAINERLKLENEKHISKNEEGSIIAAETIEIIDGHKLLAPNRKILVIGGSEVKENVLRGIAKKDFLFEKRDLDFILEYDKIKNQTDRIKPYSSAYSGIIVGPCPHKSGGSGDYASFISKLANEEGYPFTIEARDVGGTLKISKDSFRRALGSMVNHLATIA